MRIYFSQNQTSHTVFCFVNNYHEIVQHVTQLSTQFGLHRKIISKSFILFSRPTPSTPSPTASASPVIGAGSSRPCSLSQNQLYFLAIGTIFFSHNKSTLQISRVSSKFCRTEHNAVNMATIQQILYYSDFSSRIIDVAGSELALNQSSLSEFSGSLLDFLEILWARTVLAILYSAVC